jgi:DNA-binding transcriptional MerR regulator
MTRDFDELPGALANRALASIPRYRMHPKLVMNSAALSIGQVAAQANVNVQTLRYYERRGLLPSAERSQAGRRQYPTDTVRLIRFIKRAQDLGFTLKEIEELIALRQVRRRDRSRVRRLAEAKLRNVDAKIGSLRAIRKAVSTLVEACACHEESLQCPILEALDDEGAPPRSRTGG